VRYLTTISDVFDLSDLAGRIRSSSNFRFNWQFFRTHGFDPRSPIGIRQALEAIIAEPGLHQFLRDSFRTFDDESFSIDPLHEHCLIADSSQLEEVLATAANDRLGAYSREWRQPTAKETGDLAARFSSAGNYQAFELRPGKAAGCPRCVDYANHLFSSWFFGVAWDWCLFATWPREKVLWMGCLTDTD